MKRGLGKGLDALFGDSLFDADVPAERAAGAVETVRISRVEPNSRQPRKSFDPAALEELADSMREHGVLQPLLVRPLGDGRYQIIAGERRWRAARMAGLSELPVLVREYDDLQSMQIALIENLQREDLNPIEEAEGYRTLILDYGLTQDDVAQKVGKSRPTVANSMRLLALPEEVLSLLRDGGLSAGHARALLGVEDQGKQLEIAREVVEKGLSVREVERLVKQLGVEKKQRQLTFGVNYFEELETRLSERFGRKINIKSNGSKGYLQIEYYDTDDFERLMEDLMEER